ncbi:MAG: hypothetical protein H6723_12115 [Sandaracinus sp.]|nr:hypothetical protein [Sandaracinus sp.]
MGGQRTHVGRRQPLEQTCGPLVSFGEEQDAAVRRDREGAVQVRDVTHVVEVAYRVDLAREARDRERGVGRGGDAKTAGRAGGEGEGDEEESFHGVGSSGGIEKEIVGVTM